MLAGMGNYPKELNHFGTNYPRTLSYSCDYILRFSLQMTLPELLLLNYEEVYVVVYFVLLLNGN